MTSTAIAEDEDLADESADEFARMLYHITHDLRACLRALKTVPDWIRDDLADEGIVLPQAQLELLDLMACQANRGDRILLDLCTYSRIGRTSDPKNQHDLHQIIETARQNCEVPSSFSIDVLLDRDTVYGSQNDLTTLFSALISNAIKHHDKDHGEVSITATNTGTGALIQVKDDGPGIAQEYREKIFDLMYTLKSRDEVEGSGVGLSVVRKIVAQTGGSVRIADTPNARGTVVEIVLPDANANRTC